MGSRSGILERRTQNAGEKLETTSSVYHCEESRLRRDNVAISKDGIASLDQLFAMTNL